MTCFTFYFYGQEICSCMFREQHTQKNFAPKREEEPPGWIKMHNKELHSWLIFFPTYYYSAHTKQDNWEGRYG
jgi:hypothetical protein